MSFEENYFEQIEARVQQHGFAVQAVFDPEGRTADICYTIGNCLQGLPELVMFGLPPDTLHAILNSASRRMRNGDVVVSDGLRDNQLFNGYDAVFRQVIPDIALERMNVLRGWCRRRELVMPEVLQIVYPDAESRFPWEAGCTQGFLDMQPQWYASRH